MRNNFSSHVKKLTDLSDLSFDTDFVVMRDSSTGAQPDPCLKHHAISKTNEADLYDLVTKIAADAVGPGGLDFYQCTHTTMRDASEIWKAFGAKDQRYHADQWRPYTYSVIGVFGEAPRWFEFEGEPPIELLPGDLLIFPATTCHRAVARPVHRFVPLPPGHKYSKAFHVYAGAGLPSGGNVNQRTFPCDFEPPRSRDAGDLQRLCDRMDAARAQKECTAFECNMWKDYIKNELPKRFPPEPSSASQDGDTEGAESTSEPAIVERTGVGCDMFGPRRATSPASSVAATVREEHSDLEDDASGALGDAEAGPSVFGASVASPSAARIVATQSAVAAVPPSSVQELSSVPPASDNEVAHGGDGGCAAVALVALGVWLTLAEAIAALDAQIAPLHQKFVSIQKFVCAESEAGIPGEQWHEEAICEAVKAAGWHVHKLHIHPTHAKKVSLATELARGKYLFFGKTNNRWAIKRRNGRPEFHLKYDGHAVDAPTDPEQNWHHTVAVINGQMLDFKSKFSVKEAMWLRDDNQPDPAKGYMRTTRKVWRLSKCIASAGKPCRGQCKRKRDGTQQ